MLVVIATIAAIAGTLETQRRPLGSAVIAAAGVLGCVAVLSRPGATALDTIPTVAGAACGVAALRLLTRFWPARKNRVSRMSAGATWSCSDYSDSD
ncbi:membrane-bound oxidoreductase domain protein [Mycobacterium kansasii]|uniref:Membrane-bound oxidoreductase domain protein n=1 Tax=Mycobacterium kansasii TaxID=1768 RepID=A0A1V3WYQ0_MYCKA|nr:membrane-bound oxidoreductase domain protein [Mycobacterium kansasii]